jgi:hypothetical protein
LVSVRKRFARRVVGALQTRTVSGWAKKIGAVRVFGQKRRQGTARINRLIASMPWV